MLIRRRYILSVSAENGIIISMWKGELLELEATLKIYESEEFAGHTWYHHSMRSLDAYWIAEIDGRYWKKLAIGDDSTLFIDGTLAIGDSAVSPERDYVSGEDYRKVQIYDKDTTISTPAGEFRTRRYKGRYYNTKNGNYEKYEELYISDNIGIIRRDSYTIDTNHKKSLKKKRTLIKFSQ